MQELYTAYDSSGFAFQNATDFVFAGYYSSGGIDNLGTRGYWWSATAISSSFAYYLSSYTSGWLSPANNGNRYGGFSVRCVAGVEE